MQQQENGIHLIRNLIMPSKSKAQHKLMQAVAHSPEFAKKVGMLGQLSTSSGAYPLLVDLKQQLDNQKTTAFEN
jgi:hypothetical protein